jgi:hypothetical protein
VHEVKWSTMARSSDLAMLPFMSRVQSASILSPVVWDSWVRLAQVAERMSDDATGRQGAAAILGMPASTLESKIRALRINKHAYKGA